MGQQRFRRLRLRAARLQPFSRSGRKNAALAADTFLTRYFSGQTMDYHAVISILIPILVDQSFIVLMSLVNTAMISSSGVAAVSAVNMVDSLNIFLVNVFVAVSTGGTVVVAQFKGSDNPAQVERAAASSVSAVFFIALCVGGMVMLLHGPLLGLLFGGAQADVMHNARVYIIGSGASYCGIALEEAVCGVMRGIGETRSSLMLSFIMNATYMLLNFLFIGALHMGIYGMVSALNIARYFGAFCALVYLLRLNPFLSVRVRDLLHINFSMLKKIFFIGIPFAAEQMFFNGGKILTQTFIVRLGTYALAANAISGSVFGLDQIVGNSLCLLTVTVVGQCIGAHNVADARKFIRSFLLAASASALVSGLILWPLFNPIVSLFHPPAQIVPEIFRIVMVSMVAQVVLWPISFLTPSALRAAGDATYTSVMAMLSMWLFRVVLGYILGVVLPFGVFGVWLAMDCEWGVRGLIFMLRLRGEKWHRHNLVG